MERVLDWSVFQAVVQHYGLLPVIVLLTAVSVHPSISRFGSVQTISVPWDLFGISYAMGPGLDSDHGLTMVSESVLVSGSSGAQHRPSSGATSDWDAGDTPNGA